MRKAVYKFAAILSQVHSKYWIIQNLEKIPNFETGTPQTLNQTVSSEHVSFWF